MFTKLMPNFEKGVPILVHLIYEIFTQNIIKLSSKNSRKNFKKYYLSYPAHASTVLSVLHLHIFVQFLISPPAAHPLPESANMVEGYIQSEYFILSLQTKVFKEASLCEVPSYPIRASHVITSICTQLNRTIVALQYAGYPIRVIHTITVGKDL